MEFRADQPLEDGVDYIRQSETTTTTTTKTMTPGDERDDVPRRPLKSTK